MSHDIRQHLKPGMVVFTPQLGYCKIKELKPSGFDLPIVLVDAMGREEVYALDGRHRKTDAAPSIYSCNPITAILAIHSAMNIISSEPLQATGEEGQLPLGEAGSHEPA